MQRSYILSIPTPCHASLNEMTATEHGMFCQSCQKTVTDFSGMSDKEIVSFLNTNRGDICGSFRKEQLNREISMTGNARRRPLISIAAMLAAFTVAIPSAQAKSKAEKIQTIPDRSDTNTIAQQRSDTLSRITGIVTDETGEPLIGTIIKLDTLTIGTFSDNSGKFELTIPSDYTEKVVKLRIAYVGFYTQEIILPLTGNESMASDPLCITMYPAEKGGIRRAPLWYRLRYKVKRLFY